MNDIKFNYLAAAATYQAQQSNYLEAGKLRRTHRISDGDYRNACAVHEDARRGLDHAEAIWVATWR